jgi:hypothetical protein
MDNNAAPVIAVLGVVLTFGWVFRTVISAWRAQRLARIQAEMQSRLLDKMGSSDEVLAYLGSEAGQRFIESATLEKVSPHGRILGSLQTGVILALAGIAFLVLRGQVPDAHQEFAVLGTLGVALGVGFLLAGGLAWALSQRWGLLDGAERHGAS